MNGPTPPIRGRLGVCSWSLQPRCPDTAFAGVRRTGLCCVQLALRPIRDGRWTIERTRNAADAHGVTIVSGMMQTIDEDYGTIARIRATGGVRPDQLWEQNLAGAARDAEIAAELGLGLVTFHAGFIPDDRRDPLRAVMVDRVARVAEAFDARGVRVALETGQESARSLHEVLSEPPIARLGVGVNFDPANMILYGSGNPIEALRTLRPLLAQAHLKDAVGSSEPGVRWGQEVPLGRGDVDWPAFFAAIADGPAVDLIIEREAGLDRERDIAGGRALAEAFGGEP